MNINDIITVNIRNSQSTSTYDTSMNYTCAVLLIDNDPTDISDAGSAGIPAISGVDGYADASWIEEDDLGTSYPRKTEIDAATDVYQSNGGISLLYRRIYAPTTEGGETTPITAQDIADMIDELDPSVINVHIIEYPADNTALLPGIAAIVAHDDNTYIKKILYLTRPSNSSGMTSLTNVFYQLSDHNFTTLDYKAESIIACAYLSKINYRVDQIKDYEYTVPITTVYTTDASLNETGGNMNVFSSILGKTILTKGLLTNGTRLLTEYFDIVLTQKLTNVLLTQTLKKIKFDSTIYARLYNVISAQLDVFANNGLLDVGYVSDQSQEIYRDNVRYKLLTTGERFNFGYKLLLLPITRDDLTNRTYTGTYVYIAIMNQIRKIEVTGLTVGGVY